MTCAAWASTHTRHSAHAHPPTLCHFSSSHDCPEHHKLRMARTQRNVPHQHTCAPTRARSQPTRPRGCAHTHTHSPTHSHVHTVHLCTHTHTHTTSVYIHDPSPPTSSLGRRLTTGCRGAGACGFVPNSSDVFGEPVFLKSRVFCSALASTCGDALGSLWPLCVVWLVLTSTRCSGFGQEGPSALAQTVDIAHSRGRVLTNRIAQTAFPGSHPECCVHDGYIESPTFN
jgi:hypothetical protein